MATVSSKAEQSDHFLSNPTLLCFWLSSYFLLSPPRFLLAANDNDLRMEEGMAFTIGNTGPPPPPTLILGRKLARARQPQEGLINPIIIMK